MLTVIESPITISREERGRVSMKIKTPALTATIASTVSSLRDVRVLMGV
jgi:hypothetical protein